MESGITDGIDVLEKFKTMKPDEMGVAGRIEYRQLAVKYAQFLARVKAVITEFKSCLEFFTPHIPEDILVIQRTQIKSLLNICRPLMEKCVQVINSIDVTSTSNIPQSTLLGELSQKLSLSAWKITAGAVVLGGGLGLLAGIGAGTLAFALGYGTVTATAGGAGGAAVGGLAGAAGAVAAVNKEVPLLKAQEQLRAMMENMGTVHNSLIDLNEAIEGFSQALESSATPSKDALLAKADNLLLLTDRGLALCKIEKWS
jgi:hypothetical protein